MKKSTMQLKEHLFLFLQMVFVYNQAEVTYFQKASEQNSTDSFQLEKISKNSYSNTSWEKLSWLQLGELEINITLKAI